MKIAVIGLGGFSLFMEVERFHKAGETIHANNMHHEAGGKGFNQAVAAKRLGADVSLLIAVGDDLFSDICKKTLKKEKIKAFIKRKKDSSTAYATILTDEKGQNQVTVYPGARLTNKDVFSFEEEIINADILLLQNEVPEEINQIAAEIANKHGVRIVYNPAPARPTKKEFLKKVYAITPNETESKQVDYKACKNAVITMGSKGALVVSNNKEELIPCYGDTVKDTTGAGDTFTAALAVALLKNEDLLSAAKFATVAAGISVSKQYVLPSLPSLAQVNEVINFT